MSYNQMLRRTIRRVREAMQELYTDRQYLNFRLLRLITLTSLMCKRLVAQSGEKMY